MLHKKWFSMQLRESNGRQAEKFVQILLKENQNSGELYFLLSQIYFVSGDVASATSSLEQAVLYGNTDPNIDNYFFKIFRKNNQMEKALLYLKKLADSQFGDIQIYQILSDYYNDNEQTFTAEKYILQGLEIDNSDNYLLFQYYRLLDLRGKSKLALEVLLTLNNKSPLILGHIGKNLFVS